MKINSLSRLRLMLIASDIDISHWGQGEARDVRDLLAEIEAGESRLDADSYKNVPSLIRRLRVAKMIIKHPEKGYLIEDRMILPDGRVKRRGQHPAGKIRVDETAEDAVHREIAEEFGGLIRRQDYILKCKEYVQEEHQSKAYPGLPCVCEVYVFEIDLSPAFSFSGDELKVNENGTILIFKWSKESPQKPA